MIIQLCGLSGVGKSTLCQLVNEKLKLSGIPCEIIDGDDYRELLCRDLGFSRQDRNENIRRLGFVASKLSAHGVVAIICAINPYQEIRDELKEKYKNVKTIFVDCQLTELVRRDTKGLYRRAMLPSADPQHIPNLTGVNDPFDIPLNPDLYINTGRRHKEACAKSLFSFILKHAEENMLLHYHGRMAV